MRIRSAILFALLLPLLICGSARIAAAETRIALIITNGAYAGPVLSQLDSPYKDGEILRVALAKAGFEVLPIVRDANQQTMRAALNEFARKLRRAGSDAVGFFYYSGHGAALAERGENYLIPTQAQIEETSELSFNAVGLGEVVRLIDDAGPKASFVVIDACRDVPFKGRKGSGPKGFVPQAETKGMIIGFATRPGETADATNVYASNLASAIATPGLDATSVFKEVQRKVASSTGGRQVPWIEDGLLADFHFTAAPASNAVDLNEVQRVWMGIQDSKSETTLEDFIAKYGDTYFGSMARSRLQDLRTNKVAAVAPPVPLSNSNASEPSAPQTPAQQMAIVAPPSSLAHPCGAVTTTVSLSNRAAGPLSAAEECALKPKDVFKECDKCPEMVVVPAGAFTMGSPTSEPERNDGETLVAVKIAKPFAVGEFAVTFAEWDACVIEGGCDGYRPSDEDWGRVNHPVINVSWDDARKYVAWVNSKTGKTYRLLSESEREYVTRAGSTTPFWWGSSITPKQANYDDRGFESRHKTMPVDSFAANPWGLYNVHGNVWEWTQDCWNDSNDRNPGDGSASSSGDCSRHALRGGSWVSYAAGLRAASRVWYAVNYRGSRNGFRVARTLTP
jgi:formylglycine-generating enzyme required for sulfatase activity